MSAPRIPTTDAEIAAIIDGNDPFKAQIAAIKKYLAAMVFLLIASRNPEGAASVIAMLGVLDDPAASEILTRPGYTFIENFIETQKYMDASTRTRFRNDGAVKAWVGSFLLPSEVVAFSKVARRS